MTCDKGFSIIEVITGLSLFAVGIAAVTAIQIASVKNIKRSEIEKKMAFALFSFTEKLCAKGNISQLPDHGNLNETDGNYLRFYKISNHPGVANLKVIDVVQRDVKNNLEKSITLYISK